MNPSESPKAATLPKNNKPEARTPPEAKALPKKERSAKKSVKKYFLLFLVLVIGVAVAGVVYYPQQVEQLTGWRLPITKKPAQTEAAAPPKPSSVVPEQTQITEQITKQLHMLEAAAESSRIAANRAERTAQQALSQVAVLKAQRETSGEDITATRLQLINLQLQLSGDTAAAAADLRRLASLTETTNKTQLWLDEAARLENLPQRESLLRDIHNLQNISEGTETAETKTPPAEGWVGKLKALFDIRRASRQQNKISVTLIKLELLLSTGQSDGYWELLSQLIKTPDIKDAERAALENLAQRGVPTYQLQLP